MSGRSRPAPSRSRTARRWCADLAMGARFAVTGGREGWIRTTLTALGVGLGVAVLLLAASVPHLLNGAQERHRARAAVPAAQGAGPSDRSLLTASADTAYRDLPVQGRIVTAEGPHAPVPPGLSRLPGPGELAVSPALGDLLRSPDGALLKDRFPHLRITATIRDEGLTHPGELAFYQGSDALRRPGFGVERITAFGDHGEPFRAGVPTVLLLAVSCVALLVPVAVFLATAVRFGGERRDRRLAALRLVGADRATTRRIAAGEALAGALFGLFTGAALFLTGRVPLAGISLFGLGVFPSDVVPDARVAALVAPAVLLCAVGTTLVTMRRVTVEPLGVTRTARPPRRRLWWRLLLPAAGAALLLPQAIDGPGSGDAASVELILGTALLLLGVAAVLPWLLDAVVARLDGTRGGSRSWHLALRRLQLSSTAAARSVSGITVAVAAAIAVQMLLTGSLSLPEAQQTRTAAWTEVDSYDGAVPTARAGQMSALLRAAPGVRTAHTLVAGHAGPDRHQPDRNTAASGNDEDREPYPVTVADCATLRQLAPVGACSAGDVFLVAGPDDAAPRPGERLVLDPVGSRSDHRVPARWTVPRTAHRTAAGPERPVPGRTGRGLLATPEALPPALLPHADLTCLLRLDPHTPDAIEYVRNAAARLSPRAVVYRYGEAGPDEAAALVSGGLTACATAVLLLIGCGLLLTALEQLRARARLLSALDALGTPRALLGRSVLWQTAVPVVMGLTLAVGWGLALGALLVRMAGRPPRPDWWSILALTGTAAAVILGVTALSLPLLWRLMRPDGLRTE
ncbi:FtsX-like permease family protein [Streptomyces sp. 2333.5]|uniref:FtsX-like permease family protein n=1 Tax=unclassified Streptomyces TaxID=2593676 RepID=UPI00089CE3DA|nr:MULTISPECIES: FtsX-like permease family protein [unclassified Streptomyces]PJJ04140.1 FtsX-like permease family protein [Streptomyces sp. 2333.5]SEE69117.1 FtsX-like permease family protein [Streptomyces sp. 2112.2]